MMSPKFEISARKALWVGVCVLFAAVTSACTSTQGTPPVSSSAAGAWDVHVAFIKNAPPGITEETAGIAFDTDGIASMYTTGGKTTAYGEWKSTGKQRTFTFLFHEIELDSSGQYVGYALIRETGTVSKDGKTFSTSGGGQFYTPAGVKVGKPSQTVVTGTRIEL